MIKLLRTNFFKMYMSWSFWLTMLLLPVVNVLNIMYNDDKYLGLHAKFGFERWSLVQYIDSCFGHMKYFGYAAIIVAGVLIGDEFDSGALRNKIVAGYSRAELYISYIITAVCECIAVHLFSVLSAYTICVVRYGNGDTDALLKIILYSLPPVAAFAAFTVLCITAAGDRMTGMVISFVSNLVVYIIIDFLIMEALQGYYGAPDAAERELLIIGDSLMPTAYSQWFYDVGYMAINTGLEETPSCVWCIVTFVILTVAGNTVFGKRNLK